MEEQVLDDITASLFETENDDNDETSSNYTNSSAVTAAEGKTTDPVAENKIILHEEYPENIYDEPHENGFGEDAANNSNESPSAVIREVSFSMSGAIIKKQVVAAYLRDMRPTSPIGKDIPTINEKLKTQNYNINQTHK